MKPYVYHALRMHGNTIISKKTLDLFGEERILQMLRERGFECEIEKVSRRYDCESFHHNAMWRTIVIRTVDKNVSDIL